MINREKCMTGKMENTCQFEPTRSCKIFETDSTRTCVFSFKTYCCANCNGICNNQTYGVYGVSGGPY